MLTISEDELLKHEAILDMQTLEIGTELVKDSAFHQYVKDSREFLRENDNNFLKLMRKTNIDSYYKNSPSMTHRDIRWCKIELKLSLFFVEYYKDYLKES